MKDQLIILLEAIRTAQNLLEVEGHTQETLVALRSILCGEEVFAAADHLSFCESPPVAPHDEVFVSFERGRQDSLHAA